MKQLFVWVSLIAGVLPGIAVILNGFGTPEDLRKPFGMIAAVCGFVSFGVAALMREAVKQGHRRVLAGLIIASALIGLGSLCVYWVVLDQCVFQSPQRSSVFFPLWLEGRAKERSRAQEGGEPIMKAMGQVRFQPCWKAKPPN